VELKKALDLQVQYYGNDGTVRVDENGYICLNDLAAYFPHKDMSNWQRSPSTLEYISAVERDLNSVESTELKQAMTARRGRHRSGTYAHRWIAMHFAMWLSPEFNLAIVKAYEDGTQRKQDWNIKRILAANNYKIMCDSVKNAHDPAKPYHFSNEARMLNFIVFGENEGNPRETATEAELDAIAWLETHNSAYIDLGMSYQDRKAKLAELYGIKYLPTHQQAIA